MTAWLCWTGLPSNPGAVAKWGCSVFPGGFNFALQVAAYRPPALKAIIHYLLHGRSLC